MWHRTKRLINSYLDDLIQRVSGPDREARGVTRAELARLNELEVQTRASAKVLEKELAEVGLKILGVAERERIARERGDDASASTAGSQLVTLAAERDLIKQHLGEANAAAERARALREERRLLGEDLATETYMTSMRENLSSIQRPFDSTDPAATIEEMRGRIKSSGGFSTDARVAEAERELEAERARARVEDILSRYKQSGTGGQASSQTERTASQPAPAAQSEPNSPPADSDNEPGQSKTLGRTDGPVRPID
ncbi:MAG: hypothetical protein AABO57_01460 [Acidobacteriota bacterium]